ncbi:MAG: HAMP domain-containing sensor histidine kinase [Scytonema sp. PMC 1069.18]|nr:HAMP domain-containing sensor histidine kinase [Scytonema sp. PMC 1069.18]MEC4885257.1 HAMP domain-containing sensor histidine kinase [Scytonema sp. PMC 1070.18]
MNLINWVYFGVGLVLGIGIRGWFVRREVSSDSSALPSVENQDVSVVLQQLKQTQLAYHMAQEMSQFKAGFLARTTHVLRSPLNGLIGLHQLILSNLCENPEEEREFVSQAHERALKLLKLIDEILNVARIEYGTNKLNIQPLRLADVVQQVYDLTYMLAENRNFPFSFIPPDPDIYVLADPWWLRQVLINLLDISMLRMEEGSLSLSAEASPANDSVHIWLDVPTNAVSLNESIDLMTAKEKPLETEGEHIFVLSGMKLLLYQSILEVMAGKLEIDSFPTIKEKSDTYTRLKVSIPRVIPEAEIQ